MSDQKKPYEAPELVVMGGLRDIVMIDSDKYRENRAYGVDLQSDPLS